MNNYTQFQGSNPFGSQAKMLHHIDRVKEYLDTGDTRPIFIEFNITDRCNLACKWCISENCRSKAEIDPRVASEFMWDFKRLGGKALTFSGGGEPTFHPKFGEIFAEAVATGLDLGLMTNGVYPHEYNTWLDGNLKWVRFSLDTTNKDHYKKWKGRDTVDIVVKNIKELYHLGTKVGVNVNVNMEHTLEEIDTLVSELIDHCSYIQFRPVLPRYYKDEPIQLNKEVWDFLKFLDKTEVKINISNDKFDDMTESNIFPFRFCEGHFFNPVVHANGDVSVCMYHPGEDDFVFGNLYATAFPKIWKSKKRQTVIENVRDCNYTANCQMCCKLTELNKFIDFITHPSETVDRNFL